MIPVVGAGITVAVKLRLHDSPVLRRAYVTEIGGRLAGKGTWILWKSGPRTGEIWENDEGIEWIHGHGDRARAALRVARAL